MELLDLIQSIQNNLFKFLIVFVVVNGIVRIVLAWVGKK